MRLEKIKENKEIIVLIAISCLGVIAGSLLAPIEAIYISSLTENKVLLGLTFSVGTIFVFLFSIFIGRKSTTMSKKKLALIGLVAGIFYPLIYASSLNVFQYMFGRVAWAIAGVSSGVMIDSLFQDLIAKRKNIAEITGWRFSLQSICGTLAALAGGAVADVYGLKMPYYLVIFSYLLALSLFVIFIYRKIENNEKIVKLKKLGLRASVQNMLSSPLLFLRVFLEGITQSHWVMEPIIFPLIIYSMTGKNFYTGLVFALMGVIVAIVFPAVGKYMDKNSSIKGYKIAFILYTIALLICFFSEDLVVFTIGALMLSLGKAFNGLSATKIEIRKIKDENRGEYLSYIKSYDTATAAVTALIIGLLLKFFSPQYVLLIFALVTAVGGLVGFRLFALRKQQSEVN